MALYNFHRVLISAAVLFFFGFALYCFRTFMNAGDATNLAMAVASAAVCIGSVGYLVYFNMRLRHHSF